ncbi:MAG: type II secretion system minor pseudopilin GspH, partial [Pseudomonadales bacterium]
MPISTTRICNPPRGFTLLEILIVITIVGILTGTVILGFTGADAEQDLKGSAQRMAVRVELARQRALQRNREWGIYVRPDSYVFAEYDPRQQAWVEQEERPFKQSDIPELVELRLKTEGV